MLKVNYKHRCLQTLADEGLPRPVSPGLPTGGQHVEGNIHSIPRLQCGATKKLFPVPPLLFRGRARDRKTRRFPFATGICTFSGGVLQQPPEANLPSQDELYDYCQKVRRTIKEVLAEFRHVRIPLDYVFDVFPPLRPRHFSIASSLLVRMV